MGGASDEGLRWASGEWLVGVATKSAYALAAAALPAAAFSATKAALSRDASNAGEVVPREADAFVALDEGCFFTNVVGLALLRVLLEILDVAAIAAVCIDSCVIRTVGLLDVEPDENE